MLYLIYIFINKIIDKIFKILNKNFENKKKEKISSNWKCIILDNFEIDWKVKNAAFSSKDKYFDIKNAIKEPIFTSSKRSKRQRLLFLKKVFKYK